MQRDTALKYLPFVVSAGQTKEQWHTMSPEQRKGVCIAGAFSLAQLALSAYALLGDRGSSHLEPKHLIAACAAAICDKFDGDIARRHNAVTKVGEEGDPFKDRITEIMFGISNRNNDRISPLQAEIRLALAVIRIFDRSLTSGVTGGTSSTAAGPINKRIAALTTAEQIATFAGMMPKESPIHTAVTGANAVAALNNAIRFRRARIDYTTAQRELADCPS